MNGKIRQWEEKVAPKIPLMNTPGTVNEKSLPDGSKVVIVGGGIAGSSFARQLLILSQKAGKKYEIYLINSSNCNYCGGLVTRLAERTLDSLYNLNIEDDLVLKKVQKAVYLNKKGFFEVELPFKMTTLLRTSRFGYEGFDDHIKERIGEGLNIDNFHVLEPTLVRMVEKNNEGKHRWKVILSKKDDEGNPMILDADFLVMATGFRSLGRPMMEQFQKATGYQPPPTMEASVTEIDTSKARFNQIGDKIYIVDGIIDNCVLAFIPKDPAWLTLTALGRKLTKQDLLTVFNHPSVKKFIDLPEADKSPRCHTICPAQVFTATSKKFYGDSWAVVGDLNGYSRILKDGYFGAFFSGYLVANTITFHGYNQKALKEHYHQHMARFKNDNKIGILLFKLNLKLNKSNWFSRYMIWSAGKDQRPDSYGKEIHAAVRGLTTGEVPYFWIAWLFVKGMLKPLIRHPLSAGSVLFREERGETAQQRHTI